MHSSFKMKQAKARNQAGSSMKNARKAVMDASRNSKHNQHSSEKNNNVVNINLKSTHAETYKHKKKSKSPRPFNNNKGKNKN